MPRIYLSVEEELFRIIAEEASSRGISAGSVVAEVLQQRFMPQEGKPEYDKALKRIIEEAEKRPEGRPFALADLESYSGEPAKSRLGRLFNMAVAEGRAGSIQRKKTKKGTLAFRNGAALYVVEP